MDTLTSLGLSGLFISSFLAATILPLSSEGVLSTLIFGGFDLTSCLVIASVGNTLGGMTCYYLGRMGKLEWLERRMKISPEKIERTRSMINRYRSLPAFFCWLPGVGDLIAVALGYFRCGSGQVFLMMFAGKALRYIIWARLTVWTINAV